MTSKLILDQFTFSYVQTKKIIFETVLLNTATERRQAVKILYAYAKSILASEEPFATEAVEEA